MDWRLSSRVDPHARPLADRHYSRQTIGARGFVPPGRCVVLLSANEDAVWVTSWPFAEYVHHAWPGAWMCSMFRNEGPILSSDLIRQAIAATRSIFGDPPELGMITFVDASKTRHKRDPGRCFRKAGFKHIGYTKKGLITLQLTGEEMPLPEAPMRMQSSLNLVELIEV